MTFDHSPYYIIPDPGEAAGSSTAAADGSSVQGCLPQTAGQRDGAGGEDGGETGAGWQEQGGKGERGRVGKGGDRGEMAEDDRNVLFQILQLRRQAMQKEIKTMTGKK